MAGSGSIAGNNSHLDLGEISQLLESSNLSVIDETVELVRDTLGSQTEPWLLNFLVDFYIQTGNTHARDLLCMIRQHQHKALMNKIDEYLQKVSTRLKALSLLNHIIRNEPTWTYHILASRAFQSVLKCLQVDTDLPTITSALYAVATIMPKVASQLSSYLSTLCQIYVRLVSWHSIKPVGASEANLIHVHAAVYALFLCLYGMYPCYFMRFLQQYFNVGPPSAKGVLTDKEKMRVFENSVTPMLDQVRLHPGLISDSTSFEVSSGRWRKLESQDIIANISKVSLDLTENPVGVFGSVERKWSTVSDVNDASVQMLSSVCSKISTKTSRANSDADVIAAPEQSQEYIWSPSIAIGLSTPPLSRAMSPTPSASLLDPNQIVAKFENLQKSESDSNIEENLTCGRPLTLNMSLIDGFVPNRPHQTASATSTPLKHLIPSFFLTSSQSISNSQTCSPQADVKRKSLDGKSREESTKEDSSITVTYCENERQSEQSINDGKEEECDVEHASSSRKSSSVSVPQDEQLSETFVTIASPQPVGSSVFTDFSPGLLPNPENPLSTMKQLEKPESPSEFSEPILPVNKLLNLKSQSKYIEKTPNELLDLHISLVAEAYDKYKDKFPVTSNKDVEWQIGDSGGGQPSAEVMYLRSQLLQMHCAMLYERHRREQHALRARKLMRKVYDTTAMEERIKTLNAQLAMKGNEMEDCQATVRLCYSKLQSQEEAYKTKIESLKSELEMVTSKNEELVMKNTKLEQDKVAMNEECEAMKTEVAQLDSNIFKLEHKLKIDETSKDLISKMELKIRELQSRLFDAREANSLLESQVQDARGACKARGVESQIIIDTHSKELEELKVKNKKDQAALELLRVSLDQADVSLQKERSIVTEQKKYLENVKSLARGQIKAMEAKYNAQKHICQRLEIQVMELFSRLSAIEGEMTVQERSHLSTGARSIQTLSALQSDSQYQHIYSSSPQLSPPMHENLLAARATSQSLGAKTSGHVTPAASASFQQNTDT